MCAQKGRGKKDEEANKERWKLPDGRQPAFDGWKSLKKKKKKKGDSAAQPVHLLSLFNSLLPAFASELHCTALRRLLFAYPARTNVAGLAQILLML